MNEITASSEENYNNLKIAPIQILEDNLDDPAIDAVYNSSDGSWTGSLGDAEIALELISITEGLNVATQDGTDLFSGVGDTYPIGQGDDFSFTPVFYTDTDTNSGNYSAEFRLVDGQSNPLPQSGRFQINFQVPTQAQVSTPEPSAIISLISFYFGLSYMYWNRKKTF